MTVRVFASKFDVEPHEVYPDGDKTICQWLTDKVPAFDQDQPQQFSARLNGELVPQAIWPMTGFATNDDLVLTIEPKGTELFFGALFAVAITAMTPKIPKVGSASNSSQKTGDSFNAASIKGNKVKLNDPVQDIAGRTRVYPSHVVPPVRRFTDPRTQEVSMMLAVGEGLLDIPQGTIKVGETPFSSLGPTGSYAIYGPGASVSAEPARVWWHTSEEVGSTSTGNSGLTLETTTAVQPQVTATTLQFSAKVVSVPAGSGWFPHGWAAGMIARIDAQYPLTFVNPVGGGPTIVSGLSLSQLKPFVGMKIELTGLNAGDYKVATYTPYAPAVAPNAGSPSTVTGNAAPARFDYNVTPVTFKLGGGPVRNLLDDTYSWLTSTTLPTVVLGSATATGVDVPGASSPFGYRLTSTTGLNSSWVMLCPANNPGGYNVPLKAGVHTVSLYASSAVDGASIQAGTWNSGGSTLGTTVTVTATRTRYTFNITIPSDTTSAVIVYFNRSALSGNSITIDGVQIERAASVTDFVRGTRVVTISTATTDITGLVNAINDKITGSNLVASAASNRVKISTAAAPYTGVALTLTGTTSDIFGGAPVFVTGVATTAGSAEQLASMTLTFDNGTAVTGLQAGSILTGASFRDMRYRITAVSPDSVDDDPDTEEVDESHGPSTITVTRLDDTGAEDLTWSGFDFLQTSGATITLDSSSTEGDWCGPFVALPEGEITDRLEVDFFFPQGLVRYTEKNANIRSHQAKVEVQYRDFATAGAWTSRLYTFTAMSPDQQGYSRAWSIGSSYRPEVRIRRIGAESTETFKRDRVQWYALKARINRAPTSYKDITTMAVYVRGGDRLSTQSESLVSCIPTRVLPVRRLGAWQPAETTRDIAPYCLYLLKKIGYTDADLDLEEWDRLDAIWRARGDTYDNSHASGTTVQKILEDALAAGFAELTVERGLIRPVRDEAQTVFEAMYTPQLMTEELNIQFEALRGDDYDAVDVDYIDPDSWQTATVPCRLPGDAARRIQKITAPGVTSRDKAYQIGMRQRRAMKYRRKTFDWATEMDAFNSRYLSYVQVAGDVPGYAQTAEMVSYSARNVVVTEPFDWTVGTAPYYVSFRRADGTNSGPYVATKIDDYTLRLNQDLDFVPVTDLTQDRPYVLFGVGFPVQITEIAPVGTEAARVEARIYDARVYLDDNSPAPT